ncbi:MAG: cupin [Candidatus Portnoybacteria bacterium]|nr:cupin [Candidatus Portnoybacteria bacterium]
MEYKKIKHINKPWGYEEIIEKNNKYVVKKLFMRKGHQCSYQYHEKKTETIIILSGELSIITEKITLHLLPKETVTIKPYQKHRMRAEKEDSLYLECSTPEMDDVIRLKDDYGRKK